MVATPTTLRTIRKEKGFGLAAVLEAGRGKPFFPKTSPALSMIEERGTTNYHVIMALAAIYDMSHSAVAAAAMPRGGRHK